MDGTQNNQLETLTSSDVGGVPPEPERARVDTKRIFFWQDSTKTQHEDKAKKEPPDDKRD